MNSSKIRLLFVITELYKGGAEVALINLLKGMDSKSYFVDLLILRQKTSDTSLIERVPAWVRVCDAGRVNLQNGYSGEENDFLYGGKAAEHFVANKKYDIAFSYGEWCPLEIVANHVEAVEKNVWIHTDVTESIGFDEKKFFETFERYRYYIFVSDITRQKAVEKYPFLEKKSIVIHNVLNQEELKRLSSKTVLEKQLNYMHKIVTVANVRYEKGYQRILEVAKELNQRGFEFQWFCVGKFSDENLANEILSEIERCDLKEKLCLLGARDNPYPYVINADLFVLLSDYEAWPLAMAEAMLLGVPALATSTAGAKEHIKNHKNGILTSFEVKDIADQIMMFFENRKLREAIKEQLKFFAKNIDGVLEFNSYINNRLLGGKKMIERLDFGTETNYNEVEAAIHLNRYAIAKPFCKGKRVLDVASGEGYGSYLLKRWGALHVNAIDVDEKTVEKANMYFGSDDVQFLCHTAEQLPFESYSFDLITSFETIEHLDNPDKFLMELKRVLKPGGTIILSCPNDPYYYKTEEECNPFHKRKYSYFDFKELAEKYLGNHVKYYLAFAVNGFVNMPIEKSIMPADGEPAAKKNMFEMLNYSNCDNALCVDSERYLNHWNSNYYVGIWGGQSGKELGINTVIFPREFFLEVKDEDVAFQRNVKKLQTALCEKASEIERIKKDTENEIEAIKEYRKYTEQKKYKDLEQKYSVAELEKDRLSTMLEIVTKEKECLRQNAYSNYEQFMQVKTELECSRQNAQSNYEQFMQVKTELDIMKSTKGYKVLNLIYRIRCKIKKIFH